AAPAVTTPEAPAAPVDSTPAQNAAPTEATPQAVVAPPAKPQLGARVRANIDALLPTLSETERQEAEALKAFYEARADAPLWIVDNTLTDRATLAIAEIRNAGEWGLDADAFEVPQASGTLTEEQAAAAELTLARAALAYARHARGG